MISRQTREQAGGVLSFTFLDVLTCTMGSLVLLVVVLGQKAASTKLEDALRYGPRKGEPASAAATAADTIAAITAPEKTAANTGVNAEVVAKQLSQLSEHEQKLAELRALAVQRLAEEKARVSHLEDHERRLEHELAQLHITLERLADAEKEQTVDQETAERELARLKKLVADTEQRLKNLRETPGGKKSYAIIPYEGKNGTHRRPIYIECTADAAIIQPEGIQLTRWDLDGPIRSGNPLASAVRAASEELNARALAAGASADELPDPYPLILVRPDGALTFSAVVRAVENWDVQYGYELIDADWKLEYPETDARLAQVMSHAIDQARSRQAMLARAAPKSYGNVGMMVPAAAREGGGAAGARSGGGSAGGNSSDISLAGGQGQEAGTSVGGTETSPFYGSPPSGGSSGGRYAEANQGDGEGEEKFGEITEGAHGRSDKNFADLFSEAKSANGSRPSAPGEAMPLATAGPEGSMQPGAAAGGTGVAPSATSLSAGPAPDVHSSQLSPEAAAKSGAVVQAADPDRASMVRAEQRETVESAAATRGANWANAAASRRSTPMTRPIRVVVRPDQIDVVGERDGSFSGESKAVSFHQPTDKVLDELAAAVQEHIAGWGLAGQSMYWRPTLVLQVAPGADQHAIRLNDLLRDSGVDVRFQEVATAPSQEAPRATR
jgi:hypothetical protein